MSVRQVTPRRFPSGNYRYLAELPFSPEEMTVRYGLQFTDGLDDLDRYKIAAIELPNHLQAMFITYRGDNEGMFVRIDKDANPTLAMSWLTRALELPEATFRWISPDAQTRDDQRAAVS